MRQVVSRVYLIEGLPSSNVFLLTADTGLTLIDTGMGGAARSIVAQLEAGGYCLSDLRTIVLTHAHSDHTGGLAELVARSGAQVLAHQAEVAYVEGTQAYPANSTLQRLFRWVGRRVSQLQPVKVNRALADGEVIEPLGGLRVIQVPGHTPGSICLYQPERRILFCGDLLFPAGQGKLRYSIPFFCADPAEARQSAHKLAGLNVEVLCAGHGAPIVQGAGGMIAALLKG